MADKLFYTVVITSALIAIIILFFIISVIRYHRRYIRMQKERLHAQIMIQEQERKRIANDLHDSLGPMLATVKLYMYSITVTGEKDKQSLDKASDYIDETIHNLRQISYDLLPTSLSRTNLVEALKEYIYRIPDRGDLKINFNQDEGLIIPKTTELHLFRIFQEIIHNTLKHAEATSLQLLITKQQKGLLIISEDNGVGFNVEQTGATSEGLGLKSMESRCDMINGTLQVMAAPHKGCKIMIRIPYL